MKKTVLILIVLVLACTVLPAKKYSGMFSAGYTTDFRKNPNKETYMFAGPDLSISSLRTGEESIKVGLYGHSTVTIVTQMLTASHEWENLDLENTFYILSHELAGLGVIIPIGSFFDIILGAGFSYDLDLYNYYPVSLLRLIVGLGIGADFRFNLTNSFCLTLGAQTSFSIWGYESYHSYSSDTYSGGHRIDFSDVGRFSGIKSKLGLGLNF